MDNTTKKAADQVVRHREDGEEAIKRTNNVVPIDSGKDNDNASVQTTTDSTSQLEKKKSAQSENR